MRTTAKAITFTVENTFLETTVYTVTMPYDKIKASQGCYSELMKGIRETAANTEKIDKHFIKVHFKIAQQRINRTIMEFESGIKLDMPSHFEMTKTDWKILELHLEARKLACSA